MPVATPNDFIKPDLRKACSRPAKPSNAQDGLQGYKNPGRKTTESIPAPVLELMLRTKRWVRNTPAITQNVNRYIFYSNEFSSGMA